MRKLILPMVAAGALAVVFSAPVAAAPVSNLGALTSAAATLDNVEQAAPVCGRWRCWHTWDYHYHWHQWHHWYHWHH